MRATKAYIASLGTTGLLLAFSASLLVLVGTLFAFDAWPGAQLRDAVDSVLVDDDDSPLRLAGPEQVALDAAPAAVAVAALTDGSGVPGSADSGPGGSGFGGGDTTDTPGGGFGGGGTGDGTTSPVDGGTPVTGDQSIDSGRGTNQLADNTEQLTNNLGNTVGQVSPELGDTVSETGEALSDIVRGLPDVKVGDGGLKIGD
jgi:hypothetical protein